MDLYFKCDLLYKIAGLIQPPPVLVDNIFQKAKEIYLSKVLYNLNNKNELNDKEVELKILLLGENIKPINYDKMTIKNFDLDLSDWKYIDEKIKNTLKDNWRTWDTVSVGFSFSPSTHGNHGAYFWTQNKLYVYIGDEMASDITTVNHNLYNCYTTINHELQHFAQDILSDILNKRYLGLKNEKGDAFGLPPKKIRSKEHDFYGKSLTEKTKDLPHGLRDVEFYTNLSDSISDFKEQVKYVNFKREFAKAWIGLPNEFISKEEKLIEQSNIPDEQKEIKYDSLIRYASTQEPFKILKYKDQAKWKYACKIFWTEVQDLLTT